MSSTVILRTTFYGSVRLKKESRVRVSENRVLRKIREYKGEEVTGKWGRLPNEQLHDYALFTKRGGTRMAVFGLSVQHEKVMQNFSLEI
jgi:hypothetical protein